MGWDAYLFVIHADFPHESALRCMGWNAEPVSMSEKHQLLDDDSFHAICSADEEQVEEILANHCPKCVWYENRRTPNRRYILERKVIGHTYSNPVMLSPFLLRTFVSDNRIESNEYVSGDHIISKWDEDFVDRRMEELKKAMHDEELTEVDQIAANETAECLQWAKKWFDDAGDAIEIIVDME